MAQKIKPKTQPKFDPLEVPGLLEKAKAGDLVARDELLFRFQRLVASLVNVCLTGRYNPRSYQKSFLQLFGGKSTPPENVAKMLEKTMRSFDKEEIFSTGQLAVLIAIEKCNKNLASTIVSCFKDLVFDMIKDLQKNGTIVLDDCTEEVIEPTFQEDLELDMFLESLTEEECEYAIKVINGKRVSGKPPGNLKARLADYMGFANNINGEYK